MIAAADALRLLFVDTISVCQIFYELKGGQVDYGQEHSEHYGHDRLGTKHEKGLYPEVCHST